MSLRTCLVLMAAGAGKRFNGDKLSYHVNGVSMFTKMLDLYSAPDVKDRFCVRILVTQTNRSDYTELAESLGFHAAFNDCPELGISETIRIGLQQAMKFDPQGVMFSVCDQPYLEPHTVLSLLDSFEKHPDHIVAPICNGKRGNPVIFPVNYTSELFTLEGDRGGSLIIKKHPDKLITIQVSEKELLDIDYSPEVAPW